MKVELRGGQYMQTKDTCKMCFGRGAFMVFRKEEGQGLQMCNCAVLYNADGTKAKGGKREPK